MDYVTKPRPAFFAFPVGEGWDGAHRNAVIEPVEMPHSFQRTEILKELVYQSYYPLAATKTRYLFPIPKEYPN